MSLIYGHPVIVATRALRFADHVTKRNGGSGDENVLNPENKTILFSSAHAYLLMFVLWPPSLPLCLWLCLCLTRTENHV